MDTKDTPTKTVAMRMPAARSMLEHLPDVRSQMSDPVLDDDGEDELWERCSARTLSEFTGKEHFTVGYTQMTRPPSFAALRGTSNAPPVWAAVPPQPPTPKNAVSMPLPTCKNPDSPFARSWPNCTNGRRRSSGNISRDILISTLQLQSPAAAATGPIQQPSKSYRSKGVLTVDQQTTEILIANDMACKIFGLGHRKLIGKKLTALFPCDADKYPAILDRCLFGVDEHLAPVFGKAVDILDAYGKQDTVCIWSYPLAPTLRRLSLTAAGSKNIRLLTGAGQQRPASESFVDPSDCRKTSVPVGPVLDAQRWLILMEPVDAMSVSCTLGAKGRIFRADDTMAELLDYVCMSELLGTKLDKLIRAVQLDSGDHKQHVCALGARGNSIPVTVEVFAERDADTGEAQMYNVKIRALTALNGVVMMLSDGTIHSYNYNFLFSLMGVDSAEQILKDRPVTDILPNIYEDIRKASLCDQLEKDISSVNNASTSQINNRVKLTSQVLDTLASLSLLETIDSESSNHSSDEEDFHVGAATTSTPQRLAVGNRRHMSTPAKNKNNNLVESQCSIDACQTPKAVDSIKEGAFYGLVKHKDGSLVAVRFDIRRLELKGGQVLWAMWICYDRSSDLGLACPPSPSLLDGQESQDSTDGIILAPVTKSRRLSAAETAVGSEILSGPYVDSYDTLQQIGNGAFGAVKLAARKSDGLLVVTKFICKSKVLPDCWVQSTKRNGEKVPIEVHLLETLCHPNIVRVLDVFENDTYYQLVMEKLGCGMDLFEFIDRQPKVDEPLASYIFRQIVSAVSYLHRNGIVHRDLKDENVIIDQSFCCKLIDFGSAAYFGGDVLFSTFCGTMEYCSPEVLTGNKYAGPELEMWSLGILLYTLIFFENPFRTAQETVRADLEMPWDVSEGLFQVISWLLQPDPRSRATVRDIQSHWWTMQPIDASKYRLQDIVKNCDAAEVDPPTYLKDLSKRFVTDEENAAENGS